VRALAQPLGTGAAALAAGVDGLGFAGHERDCLPNIHSKDSQ
jgi:hypothetical protein